MRANALQAPEIALSVSSAGALHPDRFVNILSICVFWRKSKISH